MKLLTRRERSIAAKYRKMLKAEERAGQQYELRDRIGMEIAKIAGGDGKVVRISAEKAVEITDNYLAAIRHPKLKQGQMPKAWAHGSVRQFDFKEVANQAE